MDVTTGKFSFGNKLLPTTLVISVEEAKCTYSTKPAVCALDHFMHFFKCKADNFKILLASSPKYTGLRDEAPRFMGEGMCNFTKFLFLIKINNLKYFGMFFWYWVVHSALKLEKSAISKVQKYIFRNFKNAKKSIFAPEKS